MQQAALPANDSTRTHATPETRARDAYAFLALACAITWLLDLPIALAFVRRATPPGYAIAMAGLSAWGPTIAAVLVATRRGEVRSIFRPWRTNPGWIVFALFFPMALHLVANVIGLAFGLHPSQWFYPPTKPESVAALVMFSLGEEFGWRGFGHARLVERHGPIVGSLLLGTAWGLWHLFMTVSPDTGSISAVALVTLLVELPLYSIVFAWLFERSHRSLAVAIALHAGAHLDNVTHAPESEIGLRLIRTAVVVVAAVVAGRALTRKPRD